MCSIKGRGQIFARAIIRVTAHARSKVAMWLHAKCTKQRTFRRTKQYALISEYELDFTVYMVLGSLVYK